jgi:polyhydroxyalkanoate synthesis repressor PhaR
MEAHVGKRDVTIRKYSDRRLYDTGASRYVTLEDIARMIREGDEVQVLDSKSGKDITRLILTQIVVEDARGRESGLPMQLLRQLVVASDHATHEFLSWYINGTLELYKKAQESVHSGLSGARRVVTNPLEFVRNLMSEHGTPPAEVEALRRRVEELEARLAAYNAAAAPSRKKRARAPVTARR